MAEGEPKRGKERPYWLPFVLAVVMLGILILMFFRPDLVDRTRFTFSEWVTIGYLVTVIMFVVLLVWKITLSTEVVSEVVEAPKEEPVRKPKPKAKNAVDEGDEEERSPPKRPPVKPKKKRVVVAASTTADVLGPDDELPEGLKRPEDVLDEDIESMEGMPRVVEYPGKEPGGVYSDTLLKVDESLILNFRVLLGRVCHNCEELDDCKRRVEGKLDDDVFFYNFECKDGIKAELNRARKQREAEEDKAEAAKKLVEDTAEEAKVEGRPGLEPPEEKRMPPRTVTKKKATSKKGSKGKAPQKEGSEGTK